ncbi:MAG: hypothetical protein AB7R55_06650 [Gemmatimonadales bacterium]
MAADRQPGSASSGLAGFGRRPIASLSGGQQQRVALARTIAPAPRVLSNYLTLFRDPVRLRPILTSAWMGTVAAVATVVAVAAAYGVLLMAASAAAFRLAGDDGAPAR